MLVSFDPYINTGADVTGQYLNFMRCVTAIATAAAGTTSLTVEPWVTSGTTDATKNCITEIISNTTAGGWTVNATNHNIPATNSYSGMNSFTSNFAQQYKADFYNSSGKASMPYNKMCFHTYAHNTAGYDNHWNGYESSPMSNWTNSQYGGQIMMTYGCSTTTDFTDINFVPGNGSFNSVTPNSQSQSWTNNAYHCYTNQNQNPYNRVGFNIFNTSSVTYTMSVTSEYCIIWENHRSNSYSAGYANTYAHVGYGAGSGGSTMYGSMMYGGNRTTQAWEDSLGYNPPWVAFTIHHTTTNGSGGYSQQYPLPPNCAAAYMATINDSGTASATASRAVNYPQYQYSKNSNSAGTQCPISSTGFSGAFGSADNNDNQYGYTAGSIVSTTGMPLATPIFSHRQRPYNNGSYATISNWNANMPTVDPVTGLFVPGAYPVQFSKYLTNAWNPGGYAKGIYKSLTMPLATMKLYYAPGQVFNITGTPYTPVIFNEDMYLIAAT